jgi:hypothetical protein
LDTSFNPGSGFNMNVITTSIQADGKIIVGGGFTAFNGTARNRIARLNVNGSLDTGFNPGSGFVDVEVRTTSIQTDGKIIVGGNFVNYDGNCRHGIARLMGDFVPLPIVLSEFNLSKKDKSVQLTWTTASEYNTAYFSVERSTDGIEFQSIGIVNAGGFSNDYRFYDFKDDKPQHGINYYRLKDVDFDGSSSISPIKAVEFVNDNQLEIFPNPLNSDRILKIKSPDNIDKISVINSLGVLIYSSENPSNEIDFNMILGQGLYHIILETDNTKIVRKLLVN